ncbi:MAG: DegT/DnrJ/EryC1/StrS family aminotransferase [Acidobacteriota bacterium]|nr:DegT/DnrJ/EryC1/StrS family aminotransferase [Acidobacteriota bacterium]
MPNLAINGGPKTIDRPIGKQWPIYGDEERQALTEVLESGKWWRGAYQDSAESQVGRFEAAFAEYQGAQFGVACTNGTQAIELALKAVGIKPGDEVICPASTFVATATAVILVNAIPIVVDIEPETYQIDPDAIEAAITPRTAGIIPVHYGGYPCDMDRIMDIAARHGLFVIEDCAHAHGSQWKGKGCGTFGDFGTFSLQAGKNLTAGEGGIVLTNDEDLAAKAFSYHHIGRIAGRPFYEHHIVASNLRMTEWQGAIALAQLSRLPEQNLNRMRNFRHLEAGLREIPGVEPIEWDENVVTRRGCYFYHFKFKSDQFAGLPRAKFVEAMGAEGLGIGSGHLHPIQKNPLFTNRNFGPVCWPEGCEPPDYAAVETPVADRVLAEEGCSLGHSVFLGDTSDMDLILAAIRKVRDNVDELL